VLFSLRSSLFFLDLLVWMALATSSQEVAFSIQPGCSLTVTTKLIDSWFPDRSLHSLLLRVMGSMTTGSFGKERSLFLMGHALTTVDVSVVRYVPAHHFSIPCTGSYHIDLWIYQYRIHCTHRRDIQSSSRVS
jgi:hypothetical protein